MIARVSKTRQYELTVPVLVNHHDGEQHAKSEEEDTVEVVGDGVADGCAEGEEQDAAYDVEADAEQEVADDPSVVEGADNQDKLGYNVDDDDDEGVHEVGDEESHRVLVVERSPSLEGARGDDEADTADKKTGEAQELSVSRLSEPQTHPKAHGSSVLVELEANETVDEQAPVQSADSARVNSREPGVYNVRGRDDGGVKEGAEEFDKHVNVEE